MEPCDLQFVLLPLKFAFQTVTATPKLASLLKCVTLEHWVGIARGNEQKIGMILNLAVLSKSSVSIIASQSPIAAPSS